MTYRCSFDLIISGFYLLTAITFFPVLFTHFIPPLSFYPILPFYIDIYQNNKIRIEKYHHLHTVFWRSKTHYNNNHNTLFGILFLVHSFWYLSNNLRLNAIKYSVLGFLGFVSTDPFGLPDLLIFSPYNYEIYLVFHADIPSKHPCHVSKIPYVLN